MEWQYADIVLTYLSIRRWYDENFASNKFKDTCNQMSHEIVNTRDGVCVSETDPNLTVHVETFVLVCSSSQTYASSVHSVWHQNTFTSNLCLESQRLWSRVIRTSTSSSTATLPFSTAAQYKGTHCTHPRRKELDKDYWWCSDESRYYWNVDNEKDRRAVSVFWDCVS